MADPKTKDDRTYKDGYDAGREGNGFDDFSHNISKSWSITEDGARDNEIYNAGYEEGKKDRD